MRLGAALMPRRLKGTACGPRAHSSTASLGQPALANTETTPARRPWESPAGPNVFKRHRQFGAAHTRSHLMGARFNPQWADHPMAVLRSPTIHPALHLQPTAPARWSHLLPERRRGDRACAADPAARNSVFIFPFRIRSHVAHTQKKNKCVCIDTRMLSRTHLRTRIGVHTYMRSSA